MACQGNESLQWRPIGTTGIQNTSLQITLTPQTSIQPVVALCTATVLVDDDANQPIGNVVVNFTVLSGPNAAKAGTGTTDSHGNATFPYSGAVPGTDVIQASVSNAAGGSIQSNQVTSTWISSAPCPPPTQPPAAGTPVLAHTGPAAGDFNDPLTLAAQLTDGNGSPLSGRSLSFVFAGQTLSGTHRWKSCCIGEHRRGSGTGFLYSTRTVPAPRGNRWSCSRRMFFSGIKQGENLGLVFPAGTGWITKQVE